MAFTSRLRLKNGIVALFALLLLVWPLYQLFDLKSGPSARDIGKLMHEIALFQLEMSVSTLEEVGAKTDAGQLEPLMRQLYALTFVHDRFAQAYGPERLQPLHTPEELLQYSTRLQIRGRPLEPPEIELFREAGSALAEMAIVYEQLLGGRSGLSSQQSARLHKMDTELAEQIRTAAAGIR